MAGASSFRTAVTIWTPTHADRLSDRLGEEWGRNDDLLVALVKDVVEVLLVGGVGVEGGAGGGGRGPVLLHDAHQVRHRHLQGRPEVAPVIALLTSLFRSVAEMRLGTLAVVLSWLLLK